MIIDTIDMAANVGPGIKKRLKDWNVISTVLEFHGNSNGVGVMVNDVIKAAKSPQSIDALRIWGHGTHGYQGVSSGWGRGDFHWGGIGLADIDDYKSTLALLTPYFAKNSRAELRGCSVSGEEEGEQLLQALAKIWKVPIHASSTGLDTLDWKPPVVEATPDGVLRCITGFDVMSKQAGVTFSTAATSGW